MYAAMHTINIEWNILHPQLIKFNQVKWYKSSFTKSKEKDQKQNKKKQKKRKWAFALV